MRIVGLYETILNLSGGTDLWQNIDDVILDKLRKKYEGRCEKNTLILKILGIKQRSKVEMAISRLDGSGDVNVQYTAEAIIFPTGDIITGCEIQKIERANIICKYQHAVIKIRNTQHLQSLKPGQFLTVKVLDAIYTLGRPHVTVTAVPYSYTFNTTVYITTLDPKSISFENIELLKKRLEDIDQEYKLYEEANNKIVERIANTFYPFKTPYQGAKMKLPEGISLGDIYDLTKKLLESKPSASGSIEPVALSRHPIIDKSTSHVLLIDVAAFKKGITTDLFDPAQYGVETVNENAGEVLYKLLTEYWIYIRMLRESAEVFTSEKIMEQHNNLWSIYLRIKR